MQNIRKEIVDNFSDLFDHDEMDHINDLQISIFKNDFHELSIEKVSDLFRNGPKRPCYYLLHELEYLPDQTRDAIRYCGDYLDQLAKQCSKDLHGIKKLLVPFGPVVKSIESIIGKQLCDKLLSYNKLFYTEAKHNFEVENRDHLFSPEEVVFCCFVTRKLADRILEKSPTARLYNESKLIGEW